MAAERSRAPYIRVSSPDEVDVSLLPRIKESSMLVNKWKDEKLNVLIPMAERVLVFNRQDIHSPNLLSM